MTNQKRYRVPPLPGETARTAHNALVGDHPYRTVGDDLEAILDGISLHTLYDDPPAIDTELLGLATVLQYVEALSDHDTAAAIHHRIDWKYALRLPLRPPAFSHIDLIDFRERLIASRTACSGLDPALPRLAHRGLPVDGAPALTAFQLATAVRTLNRLLLVTRVLGTAINALERSCPLWMRRSGRADRLGRIRTSGQAMRPPREIEEREALALTVGADGFDLIDALAEGGADLADLAETRLLGTVWAWQFERSGGDVHWRRGSGDGRPFAGEQVAAVESALAALARPRPLQRTRPVRTTDPAGDQPLAGLL